MAEAKDSQNNVLQQQNVELETNLIGEGDTSPELLLAQRHRRRRYRNNRSTRHRYNRRTRNQRHYRGRRRYPRIRYSGQYYRRGQWQLVRDRRGRLMYDWRRH
ncbi:MULTISPECIES: hypothetical protein [unclassified Anabaena]|uniref:hypothetical protein n=1 Tax=unclassified Anabaena TaxID=2619674 RepID=UPI0039C6BB49